MALFDFLKRITSKPSTTGTTPSTLQTERANPYLDRPIIFDPALKQFTAHRAGEPRFQSEDEQRIWQECRMAVLQHILRAVSQSRLSEHLLLRGSAIMVSWFGDQARRPGDLDWVVVPPTWTSQARESQQLVKDVVDAIEGAQVGNDVMIPAQAHAIEEIWTYERAPGIRVVLPWHHVQSIHNGTVQMDFVFGEKLPTAPVPTYLSLSGKEPVLMRTASPEQSLAWKLVWLATDSYAAGKDLYDAVLLAEKFGVSPDVVRATFKAAESGFYNGQVSFARDDVLNWSTEWEDFIKEYPTVKGTDKEWLERLANALTPLFEDLQSKGPA